MCVFPKLLCHSLTREMFRGNNGWALSKIKLNWLNAFRAEHKQELSLMGVFLMSQHIDPSLLFLSNQRLNHLIRAERVWSLMQFGSKLVTVGPDVWPCYCK